MLHRFYITLLSCWLCLCFLPTISAQSWLTPHDKIHFKSKPNSTSFVDLIGANAGKEIGQNRASFKGTGKIKNVRSFHIMGSDYGNGFFPNEQTILPYPCDCGDEFYQCPSQTCLDEETGRVKNMDLETGKRIIVIGKKAIK